MLETLNKPNVKNIVLEETTARDDARFNPHTDISREDFFKLKLGINQDEVNGDITSSAYLKVLKPEYADHLTLSRGIEDDVIRRIDSIERNIEITSSSAQSIFVQALASLKLHEPNMPLDRYRDALEKITNELPNLTFISQCNLLKDLIMIDSTYRSEVTEHMINMQLKAINWARDSGDLNEGDLKAYSLLRIFDPHRQVKLTRNEWDRVKNVLEIRKNDAPGFIRLAFTLSLIAADEITEENGFTLKFYDKNLSRTAPIPYPILEKV